MAAVVISLGYSICLEKMVITVISVIIINGFSIIYTAGHHQKDL